MATETTATTPARPLTKMEKVAVLLLSMDEQTSGQIVNALRDDEIRKVGSALLRLKEIPAAQIQAVVSEFSKEVVTRRAEGQRVPEQIAVDGERLTERFLSRTLSRGRSQQILQTLKNPVLGGEQVDLRQLVNAQTPEVLFEIVANEHPQVIALVLSCAKRATAKAVLTKCPEEQRTELITRMAALERVQDHVARDVGGYFQMRLRERAAAAAQAGEDGAPAVAAQAGAGQELTLEGLGSTVKLLKSLPVEERDKIVEALTTANPELGARIAKLMFTMEDLERSDDFGVRELLRNVTNDDLKAALKNQSETLKERFFKNMSERAALIMREDMEVMPPLKVEDIEAAQERILDAAKKLIKEEKLKLTPVPDEDAA
ncbi:MAG: hypothetical protein HY696_12860 [Deltaproteobacteria bacterium]|nr:hypothetical protein [Deltaproteobacteria bacterium]